MVSPTEVVVLQTFPLNPMPWHVGATFTAADFESRRLLGSARVVRVTPSGQTREIHGKPAATPVTLRLSEPIPHLARGAMVWEAESANPDTTLRRCRIEMSCRLQSPVTLDSCDVTALLWFYAEKVEGPFPSRVRVRNCRLRRGRGNPDLAVTFSGCRPARGEGQAAAPGRPAIHDIVFENNEVWGDFSVVGVESESKAGNRFREAGGKVRVEHCTNVQRKQDSNE